MKKSRGFSLLEMLIASTLSLVVLGALLYLIVESQRSRATITCIKNLQTGGRAALDIIAKDITAAGYRGCGSTLAGDFTYEFGIDLGGAGAAAPQLTYALDLAVPISGFGAMSGPNSVYPIPQAMQANTLSSLVPGPALNYNVHSPAQLRAVQADYQANFASFFDPPPGFTSLGDLITIRSIGDRTWSFTDPMTSSSDPIVVLDEPGVDPPLVGDILYIGDCSQGTVFLVTGVTGTTTSAGDPALALAHASTPVGGLVNISSDLGGSMLFENQSTMVASVDVVHYALGISEFTDGSDGVSGNVVPALYRARLESNANDLASASPTAYESTPEEIAPGIVDLGLRFVTADSSVDPLVPTRVRRMGDILDTHLLHAADLSVQASAIENCGRGDDDNSTGWAGFTKRFERLLQLRNIRGVADS